MPDEIKSISYSGTQSHAHVERLLGNSRRLLIISPYIDSYYSDYLSRISSGKRVYVIASSISEKGRKALSSGMSYFGKVWLSLSFASVLFGAGVLLLGYMPGISFFALAAILLFFGVRSRNSIRLKIPHKFVHAKMYITENGAILGSANLTFRGMHDNVEHIEVVSDPDKIKSLEKQFWEIWNSS